MRRGFIAWSKIELPEAVFEARLNRVRAAMARQEFDALVLYTNNTRTAAVSWLTAFVPYWAEGLLVVPRQGEPLLAMAFSNRVVGWGKSVSRVARFEGFPRVGMAAGKYLAEQKAQRVGVVDFDGLRQAVAADLAAAAPAASLSDASALFEEARAKADAAEIALAVHAGIIAQQALARITPEMKLGAAIATAEEAARLAGAEEVYMAAAPDLAHAPRFRRIEGEAEADARFAIRMTLAYKGSWVRMTRTLFRDGDAAGVIERAGERFAAAIAALPEASGFAGFRSWLIEGCRLAQPLDPLLGSLISEGKVPAPGSLATAQAMIEIEGQNVALAAPILLGDASSPAGFLVPPIFAPR
jgi:Creatinase/Prolidase N-terminal domain